MLGYMTRKQPQTLSAIPCLVPQLSLHTLLPNWSLTWMYPPVIVILAQKSLSWKGSQGRNKVLPLEAVTNDRYYFMHSFAGKNQGTKPPKPSILWCYFYDGFTLTVLPIWGLSVRIRTIKKLNEGTALKQCNKEGRTFRLPCNELSNLANILYFIDMASNSAPTEEA